MVRDVNGANAIDDPDYGQILLDVALQFGATLDIDKLLPLVLERVNGLLHADHAAFALCDAKGRIQRAVLHNLEWEGPGHPLPVSSGLISEVLENGNPVVVADAANNEAFQARESVRLLGLRFMMGVPIPARGDRIIGVLYVDSKASKVKDLNEETRLLEALGRLVGTAVENARLFEEQRYRTRLLAHLVHDFRTPLSVILANAELLARAGDGDEAVEMAQDIAASAQRMTKMVDNTLELSRMESGHEETHPVALDLAESIPGHVRGLDIVAGPLELRFSVDLDPDLPPAQTVPDRVWIILDNLLFNALKHAKAGSTIKVAATLRPDAGPSEALNRACEGTDIMARLPPVVPAPGTPFLEVSVHNEGRPIADEVLRRIFEAYVRGDDSARGHRSTGLGMSIVDQCARHLGGTVWARSSREAGTRFCFTLPTRVRVGGDAEVQVTRASVLDQQDTLPMPNLVPSGVR